MSTDGNAEPVTEIVEISLPSGAVCIGEWRHPGEAEGGAVLLHDRGADLDELRLMGRSLLAAGIAVLNVDLPGHGLSGGDYEADGPDLVAAAMEAVRRRGSVDVAVVAHGESVGHVFAAQAAAPVGAVLIDPRAVDPPEPGSDWRRVPSVVFSDPDDDDVSACAGAVIASMNAWALRVDIHHAGAASDEHTATAPVDRLANPTILATSTKFLHEQAGYRANARRQPPRSRSRAYPGAGKGPARD